MSDLPPHSPPDPDERPQRPPQDPGEAPERPPEPHAEPAGARPAGSPPLDDARAGSEDPKRLTRSPDDKVVAGVSGGLGRYFSVDPIIFRLAFVVLTAAGGIGLVAYLAGWVLMPVQGREATPRSRAWTITLAVILVVIAAPLVAEPFSWFGSPLVGLALLAGLGYLIYRAAGGSAAADRPLVAIGIGLLLLAAALAGTAIVGVAAAALGAGPLLSGVLILCGIALVAGAFVGGARWLMLPALVLAVPLTLIAAAGLEVEGPVGERYHRPATVAEVREGYDIGMGELRVDLSNVSFPPGTTRMHIDVGFGGAQVLVPEDVCVTSAIDAGAGYANVLGSDVGGLDLTEAVASRSSSDRAVLAITADIGVGAIEVLSAADGPSALPRDGDFSFDRDGSWENPDANHPQLACEERS